MAGFTLESVYCIISECPGSLSEIYKKSMYRDESGELKSGISYSHLLALRRILEDIGLVEARKSGKKTILSLTASGNMVLYHMRELDSLMSGGSKGGLDE